MAHGLLDRLRVLGEIIGGTPLVELGESVRGSRLGVKLEYMNPTGSHKDRIALYMVRDVVERGLVGPGGVVVEASSGNTAISVAWVANRLGLKAVIVVEEGVSPVKKAAIRLLGAELVEAPPGRHLEVAEEIASERNGVYLKQQANISNLRAHYETTGPEIYRQTGGEIDYFVMGMGTCGTVAGVARYLKPRVPGLRVVGVVPRGSRLAGGPGGVERIEGLASIDEPALCKYAKGYVDEVVEVSYREAVEAAKALAGREGVLAGVSTGAMYYAARLIAQWDPGSRIVFVAADTGYKYPELLG